MHHISVIVWISGINFTLLIMYVKWTHWKPVHYKHSSQRMHLLHSTNIHILSLLKFNLYLFHTYFWEISWNKRYTSIFQCFAHFLNHCGFPHGKHVLSATVIELKSKKSSPFMKLLISTRYMFNCKQNLISDMRTSFEAYLPDILIARTEILPNSLYVLSSFDRLSASDPHFCKL